MQNHPIIEPFDFKTCQSLLTEWVANPTGALKKGPEGLWEWLMRRNERYLHHWFSSALKGDSFFFDDRLHPEWPSHKEGHNITKIFYSKKGGDSDPNPKQTGQDKSVKEDKVKAFSRIDKNTAKAAPRVEMVNHIMTQKDQRPSPTSHWETIINRICWWNSSGIIYTRNGPLIFSNC